MIDKTGRVDCKCGDQIISNSGKVLSKGLGIIVCWNDKCGRAYNYDILEKLRVDNKVVVFDPPGKDLKVFKMNDCDWWMDLSLEEAKKNFAEYVGGVQENPYELTTQQLDDHEFHTDHDHVEIYSFKVELQRRQSISCKPGFFASTEF